MQASRETVARKVKMQCFIGALSQEFAAMVHPAMSLHFISAPLSFANRNCKTYFDEPISPPVRVNGHIHQHDNALLSVSK